jgi:hypothetical protein
VIEGRVLEQLITVQCAELVGLRLHLGKLMQFIGERMRLVARVLIITGFIVNFQGFLLEKGDKSL